MRGLLRALASLDHDVLVLAPSNGEQIEPGLPCLRQVDLPVPEIFKVLFSEAQARVEQEPTEQRWARFRLVRAMGHLWTNVAVERALLDVLRVFRPAVIYERYSPFATAGGILSQRHGVHHILNVNAPLAWEGAQYRKQALQDAAEALEELALTSTSQIVTTCRELKDDLLSRGIPIPNVAVVPMGVDVDLFVPHGPAASLGLERKLTVGFLGSLKPWHGVEVLAQAFVELASDERYHLLIVGVGPMMKIFERLREELPSRVTLVGSVSQTAVPEYLRAVDIAVAPYPILERFYYSPLKVLEYMAMGKAIVASRIGQIAELIDDGRTGLLVPPGDLPVLVQTIRKLGDDPALRLDLGSRAAATARERHTWMHRAAQIIELCMVAA